MITDHDSIGRRDRLSRQSFPRARSTKVQKSERDSHWFPSKPTYELILKYGMFNERKPGFQVVIQIRSDAGEFSSVHSLRGRN